jgi:hypothetical protein
MCKPPLAAIGALVLCSCTTAPPPPDRIWTLRHQCRGPCLRSIATLIPGGGRGGSPVRLARCESPLQIVLSICNCWSNATLPLNC